MSLKGTALTFFKTHFAGRVRWQRLFNSWKFFILRGLNYGDGSSIELSGEIDLIKSFRHTDSQRKFVIFDVGANNGEYCKALITHLAVNTFEVWCFEPSAVAFNQLQKSCEASEHVHLNQLGFSDVSGVFPLYADQPGVTTASLFPLERAFNATDKLHEFEMITLSTIDDFAESNNIQYIDFLKLDIEGNELNALHGAKKLLQSKLVHSIQFEFGSCNIDSRTYFRDFWNLLHTDYNIFRIVKDGLYPVTYYTEYDEIFVTVNYYAVLK